MFLNGPRSISDSCEGPKKSKNVKCLKTGLETSDIHIKLYIRTTFLSSLKYFVLLILYCCWYYTAVDIILLFRLWLYCCFLLKYWCTSINCCFYLRICYIAVFLRHWSSVIILHFFFKLTQLLLYCCFLLRYWCLFYIVVFLKILINLYIVVNL